MATKSAVLVLCFILAAAEGISPVFGAEDNLRREYEIDQLIELALKNNPSVPSAISNIEIAMAHLQAARAYPNPDIGITLSAGESRGEDDSKTEYSISSRQIVEFPLKRLYRGKAAEAGVRVAEFQADAAKAELVYTVKRIYYSILLAQKDAEAAAESLDAAKTVFDIAWRRAELGESTELDFVKSKIERVGAERELIRAQTNLNALKAILNRLLGDSLGGGGYEVAGELAPPSAIIGLDKIAADATASNSELKARQTEVSRAGFALSEQKISIVPDISVEGFYNEEIDKTSFGGGIGITVPIWNRNQGGIAGARAEERRALLQAGLFRIEILNAIEDEYKNYKIAFEQSKLFTSELLERAKGSLEITRLSYEQGEIGLLDVLDTLRTYRAVRSEYYRILFEFYVSQIALEKIAGGKI
ncbi:MAG: TolC family protein [Deltaproteobacteria bacterium]